MTLISICIVSVKFSKPKNLQLSLSDSNYTLSSWHSHHPPVKTNTFCFRSSSLFGRKYPSIHQQIGRLILHSTSSRLSSFFYFLTFCFEFIRFLSLFQCTIGFRCHIFRRQWMHLPYKYISVLAWFCRLQYCPLIGLRVATNGN